jgi:predicted alternative tryptophan synthase beta-subunit
MLGLKVRVYMVKVSYHHKLYRRSMMHPCGGAGKPHGPSPGARSAARHEALEHLPKVGAA